MAPLLVPQLVAESRTTSTPVRPRTVPTSITSMATIDRVESPVQCAAASPLSEMELLVSRRARKGILPVPSRQWTVLAMQGGDAVRLLDAAVGTPDSRVKVFRQDNDLEVEGLRGSRALLLRDFFSACGPLDCKFEIARDADKKIDAPGGSPESAAVVVVSALTPVQRQVGSRALLYEAPPLPGCNVQAENTSEVPPRPQREPGRTASRPTPGGDGKLGILGDRPDSTPLRAPGLFDVVDGGERSTSRPVTRKPPGS
jgi:hypothetical protein